MVWAVSLLTMELIPHSLTGTLKSHGVFWVCINLVQLSPPALKQCFTPPWTINYRCASTHFGENQLAPSSIGISPLPTGHPLIFQHKSVRTSTSYYWGFILPMGRSPGFGSFTYDKRAFNTRFRLGSWAKLINQATCKESPAHSSTGTQSNVKSLSYCL